MTIWVFVWTIGGTFTIASLNSNAFWQYLFPNTDIRKLQYPCLTIGITCLTIGMIAYLHAALGYNSPLLLPSQALAVLAMASCLVVIYFKRPFG